ncbi:MAG: alpha-1,2-fucosyltransferase [Amphritea sp.]|nr:alpha-1,2-fucosyltransferase [Amphritea sp.]
MVIVKIIGGLGNQMFQYAYALSLKNKGYDVKLDLSAFVDYQLHGGYQLGNYNLSLEEASETETLAIKKSGSLERIFRKFKGLKSDRVLRESNSSYDVKMLNPDDNHHLIGYFQSEKYFADLRDVVLAEFSIRNGLCDHSKQLLEGIESEDNSVSLHIRRGDYVSNPAANAIHGLCDLAYYENAIEYLKTSLDGFKVYVFSDDIAWSRENLIIENAEYIEPSGAFPGEDMYLMSRCKHNIIANSSFSWWGAWLNTHTEKIVIAPEKWYADPERQPLTKTMIPESWLSI